MPAGGCGCAYRVLRGTNGTWRRGAVPAKSVCVPYEYDESAWPVVQFRFIGRLELPDIDRYFADGDAVVAGARSYACVMDGTAMLLPEVDFVRRQARWIREHQPQMRRVNRGVAFVTQSALIRGLVRAILHLQPLPVPYASFGDVEEAMAWAHVRAASPSRSLLPRED